MQEQIEMVKEFQKAFDHPIAETPTRMRKERREFRARLIREEIDEFVNAESLVDQLDALLDALYFIFGTAIEMGVTLDKPFEIVHNCNMAKLVDGKPVYREDGKVLKPQGWEGPEDDLAIHLALEAMHIEQGSGTKLKGLRQNEKN